jgi:hypothetical protein
MKIVREVTIGNCRQYGGMFPGEMAALMQRRVELGDECQSKNTDHL